MFRKHEERRGVQYKVLCKMRFDILPLGPMFVGDEVQQLLKLPDLDKAVLIPTRENYGSGEVSIDATHAFMASLITPVRNVCLK